jgi:hypothetical protein
MCVKLGVVTKSTHPNRSYLSTWVDRGFAKRFAAHARPMSAPCRLRRNSRSSGISSENPEVRARDLDVAHTDEVSRAGTAVGAVSRAGGDAIASHRGASPHPSVVSRDFWVAGSAKRASS